MRRGSLGFSLAEVMVVVAVIGILSAVIYANFGESSAQSRDAKRQADVRALESALELYKNAEGRYPEGCNGPNTWSGQKDGGYSCQDGTRQYIKDLAPEYIAKLPSDPRLNGNDSGYVYMVNSEGTVYKFMVKNTVETEEVDYDHPFKSCDATNQVDGGVCDSLRSDGSKPGHCQENDERFQKSYGAWGGFADEGSPYWVERRTEDIICEF